MFRFEGALPARLEEQKSLLRSLFGGDGWELGEILRCLEGCDELYLDHVSQIVAPAWSRGSVGLIGDAAFCPSLLAGQGSALAIIAAYVLAGELTRADSVQEGLKAYEHRLRGFMERKQAAAARFARAFAPRTELGLRFRNLVIRLLGVPGLARLALGADIRDRIELPDYGLRPH